MRIRLSYKRSKAYPVPRDAFSLGLPSEIAHGAAVWLCQPKHAAFDMSEQPHPDGENLGRQLVGIVEAAEDKSLIRQPGFVAGRRAAGDRPRRIIWEIAVRQMDDLLLIGVMLLLRDDDHVGDDIIDIRRAHR